MPYYEDDIFPLRGNIPSLEGYSLPATMRLAFGFSKKTDAEIAAEMGWSASIASRVFNNQDYWPSLPTLPKLCIVLGNEVIPRWVIDNSKVDIDCVSPIGAKELFSSLRKLMQDTATLIEEGEKALDNEVVMTKEAKRVINALKNVFHDGSSMLSGLQSVIQKEKEDSL